MAKIKVTVKDSQVIVKSKLDKTESVNEREVDIFQKRIIRGYMRPVPEKGRKISYLAPIGVPLNKYLQKGLSKNDFFMVFAQIVEGIRKIEKNALHLNNLVLNMKYIIVNKSTKELYFIYQPIISQAEAVNLFSFMYDVIHQTNLRLSEDDSFLNELVKFLQSLQTFSVEKIEQYITKVYPDVYKQIYRDGAKQSQWGINKKYFEGLYATEDTGLLEDDDAFEDTGLLDEYDEGGADTTLLLEDDEPATGLMADETLRQQSAHIIRIVDSQRVEISKPVFRIGKEKSYVDYFVTNNSAVSRLHADIISRNNRFFVVDNNSTNGTFINGILITEKTEIEIFDGDELKLANERFEFHIV